MKRLIYFSFILLPIIGTLSCQNGSGSLDNFNKEVYLPQYAEGFSILGAEGMESTILRVTNPWQGAENVSSDLFIARGGEKVPAGFSGQVIRDSAARVVCMSSTHVAMLDVLGAVEKVAGVSGIDFVSNPYVVNNRDKVGDVGYDGNINFEVMLAANPDIVLLYGVNGASVMETKLRELDIPFVYIGEYMEQDPLGKSEWSVAISEIVGRRDEGIRFFSQIPEKYHQIKEKVSALGVEKPKVMINTPYGDTWFMAFTTSYMARLIADAGGDYLYKKNDTNRSLPIDMEEAAILINSADVWINVDGVNSRKELCARYPGFADAPCVKAGRLYKNDRRRAPGGGNDYWESGVVYPDLVLQDIAKALYPDHMKDVEYTYYRVLE